MFLFFCSSSHFQGSDIFPFAAKYGQTECIAHIHGAYTLHGISVKVEIQKTTNKTQRPIMKLSYDRASD